MEPGSGDVLETLAAAVISQSHWVVPIVAIFARLSAFLFLLPGLGETTIPVRLRLIIAFMLTWLIVPVVLPQTGMPGLNVTASTVLILRESLFGLFLGFAFRLLVFSLQIMGNIVSQALSISQVLGEGIATEPNTTLSSLFMLAGVTLLVTMNLHVEAAAAFIHSYDIMPMGRAFDADVSAYWLMKKTAQAFTFGVTLALPFVLMNFIYNLIIGFLNRSMPQLMVSFVGMPAITGVGLVMLALASGIMLTYWGQEYAKVFDVFQGARP